MLKSLYQKIATTTKVKDEEKFVEECMNCEELNSVAENMDILSMLDEMDGSIKFVMILISKYIMNS